MNSKLLLAATMIDETNEDIDMAISAINDGQYGIVHPQILTPKKHGIISIMKKKTTNT